jgi:hypothetical protein
LNSDHALEGVGFYNGLKAKGGSGEISGSGYHEAIVVDGAVFDNHSRLVTYEAWYNDLEVAGTHFYPNDPNMGKLNVRDWTPVK